MKVMISVDMEGIPDIFHTGGDAGSESKYQEGRLTMTRFASLFAEEYHRAGVGEIVVEDAHGDMTNLLYNEMPPFVRLVKGGIRPLDMVYGVDGGFDGIALIGYHSAAGTAHSSFDHTYDGDSFHRILVNGEAASEYLLCSLVAGESGVPVILVAGDDKLRGDVASRTPWAEYVQLKESSGYWSSSYGSPESLRTCVSRAVSASIAKLSGGGARPLNMGSRFEFTFEMKRSVYADVGEMLPGVERTDGYTLKFHASSASDGFRMMQILSYCSIGVESSL